MLWAAALSTAKMYEINEIILAVGPFALTFLILIVMHFLGVPLFPLSVFGKKVRRLPHFYYSKDGEINLTHRWYEKKLLKLEQKDEIKVIYGECSDCTRIETALKHGLSVEAIIGPIIWEESSKKRIRGLMEKYQEKLSIYISPKRAERHAELLGPHFFLEDPHGCDKHYESSIVVENASEELISHFKMRFEEIKEKAKRATISDIQNIKVYRRNEDD